MKIMSKTLFAAMLFAAGLLTAAEVVKPAGITFGKYTLLKMGASERPKSSFKALPDGFSAVMENGKNGNYAIVCADRSFKSSSALYLVYDVTIQNGSAKTSVDPSILFLKPDGKTWDARRCYVKNFRNGEKKRVVLSLVRDFKLEPREYQFMQIKFTLSEYLPETTSFTVESIRLLNGEELRAVSGK